MVPIGIDSLMLLLPQITQGQQWSIRALMLKLGLILSVVELHMLLLQFIAFLNLIIMLLLQVMRKFLLGMLPVL